MLYSIGLSRVGMMSRFGLKRDRIKCNIDKFKFRCCQTNDLVCLCCQPCSLHVLDQVSSDASFINFAASLTTFKDNISEVQKLNEPK